MTKARQNIITSIARAQEAAKDITPRKIIKGHKRLETRLALDLVELLQKANEFGVQLGPVLADQLKYE